MKTVLPNKQIGESKYGRWTVGDNFTYDGNLYKFFGRELTSAATLHALKLVDSRGNAINQFVTFSESRNWKPIY